MTALASLVNIAHESFSSPKILRNEHFKILTIQPWISYSMLHLYEIVKYIVFMSIYFV